MLNLNEFAKKVTLREGKAKSLSIAQVKEVMKIVLGELAAMSDSEALKVIDRYRRK